MWQSIIDCMGLFGNIILLQEETGELLKRFLMSQTQGTKIIKVK